MFSLSSSFHSEELETTSLFCSTNKNKNNYVHNFFQNLVCCKKTRLLCSNNEGKRVRIRGFSSYKTNRHVTEEATPPIQGKTIIFISLQLISIGNLNLVASTNFIIWIIWPSNVFKFSLFFLLIFIKAEKAESHK